MTPSRKKQVAVAYVATMFAYHAAGKPGIPPLPDLFSNGGTAPSAEMRDIVSDVQIAAKSLSADEHQQLSAFWNQVAEHVSSPDSPVKTTGQVRDLIERSGKITFGGKRIGSGLSSPVDGALTRGMGGKDDKPLDDSSRRRAAETLHAIGWAVS